MGSKEQEISGFRRRLFEYFMKNLGKIKRCVSSFKSNGLYGLIGGDQLP